MFQKEAVCGVLGAAEIKNIAKLGLKEVIHENNFPAIIP